MLFTKGSEIISFGKGAFPELVSSRKLEGCEERVTQEQNYVIEMRHITKEFGTFKANDNVNLQVKKGEIHALLGENGAGKSTLMNMLSGILEPTSGEIYLNGKAVKVTSPTAANRLGKYYFR